MVKTKHKDYINLVPTMPCENSSWIMGLKIYGEGRTQIPSLPAPTGPLPRIQDRQGLYWYLYWYKVAKNTKINHIMVSCTDHYNAIYIDRFPSKTKTGKDSWYFNNPLSCKPEVFSAIKTFICFIKNTQKNKYSCSGPRAEARHLKFEVTDWNFPNCSNVINRTCQYLMLIM